MDVVNVVREALPYLSNLAGQTIVVKIGGSTLGSNDTTLEDLVALQRLHVKVVVVHGGGAIITDWLKRIGKQATFVRGLRVTDAETMEVVTMALAGKVNKDLVGQIQALGGRAVGLSGLDGGLMRARQKDPDLGAVGEVTSVDAGVVHAVSASGYIPFIAPLALADDGSALNLNADTAAGEIAVALRADRLLFLTDVEGIRQDGKLLSQLTATQTRELIAAGVISGGMIPKAEACIRAVEAGHRSHIIDGRTPGALIRELFTDAGVGTMITEDAQEETRV
jgi:acetylglutamate kinase